MFFGGFGGVGGPSGYGSSLDPVVKITCRPGGCVEHCEPPSIPIMPNSGLIDCYISIVEDTVP